MKVVSIEEFRSHVDEYLAAVAEGDVVLTRDGQPCVLLRAVAAETNWPLDELTGSPAFWEMIRQRRQQTPIPWEQARKELDLD